MDVAEPATGSTLTGETGHGGSGTSSSGECLSMLVKLKSSPELESSHKLTGAALQLEVLAADMLQIPIEAVQLKHDGLQE